MDDESLTLLIDLIGLSIDKEGTYIEELLSTGHWTDIHLIHASNDDCPLLPLSTRTLSRMKFYNVFIPPSVENETSFLAGYLICLKQPTVTLYSNRSSKEINHIRSDEVKVIHILREFKDDDEHEDDEDDQDEEIAEPRAENVMMETLMKLMSTDAGMDLAKHVLTSLNKK
jgi:hypothetical protein